MESWAEKYRPNTLSEIIGNTKTISQLQNWGLIIIMGSP